MIKNKKGFDIDNEIYEDIGIEEIDKEINDFHIDKEKIENIKYSFDKERLIKDAIDKSNAEVMYVCNIVTQPGETDNFKVSDHVNALNEYLGDKKVSVVVANSGAISKKMAEKYSNTEQKDPVIFDKKTLKNMGLKIISDDFVTITDDTLRHDVIKLGLQIFTYLLEG